MKTITKIAIVGGGLLVVDGLALAMNKRMKKNKITSTTTTETTKTGNGGVADKPKILTDLGDLFGKVLGGDKEKDVTPTRTPIKKIVKTARMDTQAISATPVVKATGAYNA